LAEPQTDVSLKPAFRREPRAWLRRKLKLKLNDMFGPLRLRVMDRVDFTALRSDIEFAHILDVGVAFGTPDLWQRYPGAFLDLFEPSPRFYAGLEEGVLKSRPGRLHRVAAGSEDGEAEFHLSGPASSSLLGTADKPGRTFPTIKVPVRRLDNVLTAADIRRPCILKIDTEGYELAVLKGAEGILSAVDCVMVELHFGKSYAYAPQHVLDLLGRHRFALTDMLDYEVSNGRVICSDFIFERRV
jgi:FkbM family methyltransferase